MPTPDRRILFRNTVLRFRRPWSKIGIPTQSSKNISNIIMSHNAVAKSRCPLIQDTIDNLDTGEINIVNRRNESLTRS